MSALIKQSVAETIRIGPFLDKTNGVTEETGALVATDIQVSKDGAAFVNKSDATAPVLDADGWYSCVLNTADTGTLGKLIVKSHNAGVHLPVWHEFMVVPAKVYDSLVLGTDNLEVDTIQWLGTAAATPTVAGVPEVDVTHHLGTAAATPTVAGVPEVDVTHWLGTAAATPSVAGVPEVDVTHWRGGVPNVMQGGRVESALIAAGLAPDAVTRMRSLVNGTADSGTTTTMVDAARTEADTDYWKDCWILFTSGNIDGQPRLITGFTPASDTVTFTPATTQAVATNTYEILPASEVGGTAGGTDWGAGERNEIRQALGITGTKAATAGGNLDDVKTKTDSLTFTTANKVDSRVDRWLGSAAPALVGSRLDASVGAMATDVFDAAALAASATNEIVDQVWDEQTSGHVLVGSYGLLTKTNLDAILADTGSLDNTKITTARANNLDNLDAAITTRTAPADNQTVDMAQALPGSPTADTTGDALKQATREEAIKKNAALSDFEFLMVDSTDHVTPKTGLTVTGERSIDAGAFAAVSGAIAEVSNGIYQFDALAADTNGGLITWRFSSATADDAFFTFKTVT